MQVGNQEKSKRTTGFVLIFFLSGAAGLAYQMVWAKAFVAGIGSDYPAVLAVVTAFMTGMALGNLLLLNRPHLSPKLYGILELLIGVWGVATVLLIPLCETIVFRLLGSNPAALVHWTVVFATVTVCLLPATTAMGATLAAAERFVTSRLQHHSTGLLYGVNTAGAMLGALAAAFYLMPALGIRGSLLAFASVNLLCGAAALFFVRGARASDPAPQTGTPRTQLSLGAKLFAMGLLGIGLEVVVIRALNHVLENTVYTFAVALAVYLAGTAIGAFLAQQRAPLRFFRADWLFAALGVVAVLVGLTLRWAAPIYRVLRETFGDSLASVALAECLVAAIYFLLPTLFMGAIWTLLAQQSLARRPSLAWAVALNTAGAALGPIIFGLFAIPLVGLKGALAVFPVAYALLAGRRAVALPILVLSVISLPMLTSVRELVESGEQKIVSLKEGIMGSVAVLEAENGDRVLKFNNRFQMGGTAARAAEERQAAIPLLLHGNPRRALFIGLGTGITFASAESFPLLQAQGVELVPEIADAMRFFNEADPLRSGNLRTLIADGRRLVRTTQDKFDVIVGDLFHPAQDSAGFLYTREHFSAIRDRLDDGGIFCQWLPLYQMDLQSIRIVMATFSEVFPMGELWLLRFHSDLPVIGLMGRINRSKYSVRILENRLSDPALTSFLKPLGLTDAVRLLGGYIGPILPQSQTPINSDWNPVLIFNSPQITFRRQDNPGQRLLTLISELRGHPGKILEDATPEFADKVDRFMQARDVYLHGLDLESKGDRPAALRAYIESARLSVEFTAGYAQAITIAAALVREHPEQSRTILNELIAARPELPVAAELLRRLTE